MKSPTVLDMAYIAVARPRVLVVALGVPIVCMSAIAIAMVPPGAESVVALVAQCGNKGPE